MCAAQLAKKIRKAGSPAPEFQVRRASARCVFRSYSEACYRRERIFDPRVSAEITVRMDNTTRLIKPLDRLSKSLVRLKEGADPETVHAMRTATRRVEALFAALFPDPEKRVQKLLRSIAPLRKAAGRVRDLDVLIGDLLALEPKGRKEGMIDLVEMLARKRTKEARKLTKAVAHKQKKVRRRLKRWGRQVEQHSRRVSLSMEREGAAQAILNELLHWPDLREENMHAFRIVAKELRYILELRNDAPAGLLDALGTVKDSIGEWHDWTELSRIAGKKLHGKEHAKTLAMIDEARERHLKEALFAANRFKTKILA